MKINTLTVAFADIGRLLTAIEKLGVTPPETLSDVLKAHARLTQAPPPSPTPSKRR